MNIAPECQPANAAASVPRSEHRARYCGNCGEPSASNARFCTSCGVRLEAVAPAGGIEGRASNGLDGALHLLAENQVREALAALDAVCEERPDYAVARAYRGVALLRLARVQEARADLEQAVALAPSSFICRTRYAEFLATLGFYDQALEQLDRALRLPAPGVEARESAVELRRFVLQKAKGMFYRRTATPAQIRLRNLIPLRTAPVRGAGYVR